MNYMNYGSKGKEDDSDKVTLLYKTYKVCMYKEANRILNDFHLAEDAVQQAFIKVIANVDKIEIENVEKTRNFLIIICRNIAINMYNKRARLLANSEYIDLYDENDSINFGTVSCPSNSVIETETLHDVLETLEELPNIYKDLITLEILHNYSKKEIAKLLNLNYDTVKKRIERGRKILTEKLDKKGVTMKWVIALRKIAKPRTKS